MKKVKLYCVKRISLIPEDNNDSCVVFKDFSIACDFLYKIVPDSHIIFSLIRLEFDALENVYLNYNNGDLEDIGYLIKFCEDTTVLKLYSSH